MGLGLYAGGLASQLAADWSSPRPRACGPDPRSGGFEDYLAQAAAVAAPSRRESIGSTATSFSDAHPDDPYEGQGQGDEIRGADEATAVLATPLAADQASGDVPAAVREELPPVPSTPSFTTPVESDSVPPPSGQAGAGVPRDGADAVGGSAEQPALPRIDQTSGLTPDLPVRKSVSRHTAGVQPEGEARLLAAPPPAENSQLAAALRLAYSPGRFEEEQSSAAQPTKTGDGESASQRSAGGSSANERNNAQTFGAGASGGDAASVPPSLNETAVLPKAPPPPVETEPARPSVQERKARRALEQVATGTVDESTNDPAAAFRPSTAAGRRGPDHFNVLQGADREGERAGSDAEMLRTFLEAKGGDPSAGGDRLASRSHAALGSTSPTRAADPATATSGARLGSIAVRLGEAIAAEIAGPDGPAEAARVVAASSGGNRFQLTMRLEPPELGALRLQLQMQGAVLNLRVEAETGQVARLIESRLAHLRETLAAHGIQIERTDIVVRSSGSQEAAWQQQGGDRGEGGRGESAGASAEQLAGDPDHRRSEHQDDAESSSRSSTPRSEEPEKRPWLPNVAVPTSADAMTESLLDLVA